MKNQLECPYCDGTAHIQRQAKEIVFRKDTFKIFEHFYKCEKCHEEFSTTEVDEISVLQLHNQYRELHKIPFPQEIKAIKEKYKLSALKMSEVLGLGVNGYSNYENGEVPTPAIGNLIRAATSPVVFLTLLEGAKNHFNENSFDKIKEHVEYLIQNDFKVNNMPCIINSYYEPNKYTGYTILNLDKIGNSLLYFLNHCKEEYNDRLKINKLLFYLDFSHYRKTGHSLTGLSYRAIQYGPVPTYYDNILSYFQIEELILAQWGKNNISREIFIPATEVRNDTFSSEELESLELIKDAFKDLECWALVDRSHEESAWKEQRIDKSIISYQDYAFSLKGV